MLIAAAWVGSHQILAAQPAISALRGPGSITNPPGSIASAKPLEIGLPGAKAWRVVYRSGGIDSEQIEVSE